MFPNLPRSESRFIHVAGWSGCQQGYRILEEIAGHKNEVNGHLFLACRIAIHCERPGGAYISERPGWFLGELDKADEFKFIRLSGERSHTAPGEGKPTLEEIWHWADCVEERDRQMQRAQTPQSDEIEEVLAGGDV